MYSLRSPRHTQGCRAYDDDDDDDDDMMCTLNKSEIEVNINN